MNEPETIYPVILAVPDPESDPTVRERVKRLSALARNAAAMSAGRRGGVLEAFPKDGSGVPQPENGFYWSVSHKPLYVAGVAAAGPVGIDVEQVRPVRAGMYARTGSDGEWDRLGGRRVEAFFRLWTAKEAVLKASGTGLRDLNTCIVEELAADGDRVTVSYAGRRWRVVFRFFESHVAAVAANKRRVRWITG